MVGLVTFEEAEGTTEPGVETAATDDGIASEEALPGHSVTVGGQLVTVARVVSVSTSVATWSPPVEAAEVKEITDKIAAVENFIFDCLAIGLIALNLFSFACEKHLFK